MTQFDERRAALWIVIVVMVFLAAVMVWSLWP
jgi:hypothetical protein